MRIEHQVSIRHGVTVSTAARTVVLLILASLPNCGKSWPRGTYGLPMAQIGCPNASNFHWLKGFRTQNTESGNQVSSHVHLAGRFEDSVIQQKFCIKQSLVQDGDQSAWPIGEYCIYKKGSCPPRFGEGYIYWDDASSFLGDHLTRQSDLSTLPDGDYGANTKIWYCCRGDGKYYKPVELAVSSPFYLFKFAKHCQKIVGMSVKEEWVLWKDERSVNMNHQKRPHPSLERSQRHYYSKLYYCYYEPHSQGSSAKSTIIAVAVVLSVGGIIILAVVVYMIAKKRARANDYADDYSVAVHRPRPVLQTQRSEVAVNTEVSCAASEAAPMIAFKTEPLDGACGGDQPPSYEEAIQQQNDNNEERSQQEKSKVTT